ncbi:MAG: ribosome small subunit-dependent GTPase A, partial [Prevotellaceae bacterium]|nr:ribosome small subunit-dependent GTPase A [Prevotellaceae bacterium]
MTEGLVIKCTGSDSLIRLSNGELTTCKVKGNFRIKGIKSTSPVVVGDRVMVDEAGFIHSICERRNCIVRKPTNL